jgi:transcription elongation GreA/GreB family factor
MPYKPNQEFLEMSSQIEDAILPHEGMLARAALAGLDERQQALVEEKIAVTGGDDWHDGAFRETDKAAIIIGTQASELGAILRAQVFAYPEETEDRVTLGSTVRVSQKGSEYEVQLVGAVGVYDKTAEAAFDRVSIKTPIAIALLGRKAGETAMLYVGGRESKLEVLEVDQTILADEYRTVSLVKKSQDEPA